MGTTRGLVDRLVELDGTGYWCSVGRLCALCYDSRCGFDHTSRLCAHGIPDFPVDGVCHANPRMYFQYAHSVDREVQFLWIDFEYDRVGGCDYYDSGIGDWNCYDPEILAFEPSVVDSEWD